MMDGLPVALPIAHLTAVGQAELDVLIAGQAGTPIRDLLRSDVLELPERGAARNMRRDRIANLPPDFRRSHAERPVQRLFHVNQRGSPAQSRLRFRRIA